MTVLLRATRMPVKTDNRVDCSDEFTSAAVTPAVNSICSDPPPRASHFIRSSFSVENSTPMLNRAASRRFLTSARRHGRKKSASNRRARQRHRRQETLRCWKAKQTKRVGYDDRNSKKNYEVPQEGRGFHVVSAVKCLEGIE